MDLAYVLGSRCGGSSGQGQTDSSILEARPDSAPETGGLGDLRASALGLNQFKQRAQGFGLDFRCVFRPLKILPGQNMPGNSLQKCQGQDGY